jgi:hypothetical protein
MARRIPDELLARHHVLVGSDNAFQRQARLLQALWREDHELPVGLHRGKPLGSRIEAAFARETLANFLTDGIREVVRHAVLGPGRSPDQLIDEDRLFGNLLSSQPLCFNLFGEVARDLELATRVFRHLAPERVERVTGILFEHSPGRGDLQFTGDRSAFDVFVTYVSPAGKLGFLGIEVKYHEALRDRAASHRERYDEVAEAMGCFVAEREALRGAPLQQIWRDHLLAGALIAASVGYDEGAFVFLAPEGNVACARALERYREQLTQQDTFVTWTLEQVLGVLSQATDARWVRDVHDRYLALGKVDDCVRRDGSDAPGPAEVVSGAGDEQRGDSMSTEADEVVVEAAALRPVLQRLRKLGGRTPGPGIWRIGATSLEVEWKGGAEEVEASGTLECAIRIDAKYIQALARTLAKSGTIRIRLRDDGRVSFGSFVVPYETVGTTRTDLLHVQASPYDVLMLGYRHWEDEVQNAGLAEALDD